MTHAIRRTALALALLAAPALAGVVVVDAGGGGDATDIPDAVALAGEGDVLLVKPGTYSGFSIDGKSLHVVADGGVVVVDGRIEIRNLAANQRAFLDDIDVLLPFPPEWWNTPPALTIDGCAGSVRIERCIFRALSAVDWDICENMSWPAGPDGVRVQDSDDVVISSSVLEGGTGLGSSFALCFGIGSNGGRGLYVQDSDVSLHEVIARGADGRIEGQGGIGGTGVDVQGASEVIASGLVAEGGDGGVSTDFVGGPPNGDGGIGLRVGVGATVRTLGSVYSGGDPGSSCCWETSPGEPTVVGGDLEALDGAPRRLFTSSPTREGGTLTLSITGEPGDVVSLLVGIVPGRFPLKKFGGALYFQPATMIGPLPLLTLAPGENFVPLPVPELGPGIDVAPLGVQVFAVSATGDEKILSAPGQAVLLDDSF